MDWTSDTIDQIRALWAEGHSTAEIGRRMGITKNAVVGKAHRLNLPARPSPIRRDAQPARIATPAPRRAPVPATREVPLMRRSPPAAPVAASAPAPQAVVRAFPRLSTRSCCWPQGEPGTPEFRFCDSGALPGKPYCPAHAAVAYVKARDRREDAA